MSVIDSSVRDGVATVVLNRPQKANALDGELVEALHGALDAAADAQVRLLVLRGAGRNFCAGFDFSGFEDVPTAELCWRFVRIEQFLQRLAHAPFATLAMAQGGCFGAGADMVAACDTAIATPDAKFRMPGWRFGLALGTRRLAARVGAASARRVLASSTVLVGDEALRIGLVDELAAADQWEARIATAASAGVALERNAQLRLGAILREDTRAADMASLVESLTAGDLKARIAAFRGSP